ncbi:hypothetical protein L9F63_008860, partial [Diploptera punctata]
RRNYVLEEKEETGPSRYELRLDDKVRHVATKLSNARIFMRERCNPVGSRDLIPVNSCVAIPSPHDLHDVVHMRFETPFFHIRDWLTLEEEMLRQQAV